MGLEKPHILYEPTKQMHWDSSHVSLKVLIGDEPETGMENLMEVDIPRDVEEKLKELDVKEQQQIENEAQDLPKQESEETNPNESLER